MKLSCGGWVLAAIGCAFLFASAGGSPPATCTSSSLRVVDRLGSQIGGAVFRTQFDKATVFFETEQGTFMLDVRGDEIGTGISYYLEPDCQGHPYADATLPSDRMVPFQAVVVGATVLVPDLALAMPSPGIQSTRHGNGDCTNGMQGIETIVPLVQVADLSEFQRPFRIEPEGKCLVHDS